MNITSPSQLIRSLPHFIDELPQEVLIIFALKDAQIHSHQILRPWCDQPDLSHLEPYLQSLCSVDDVATVALACCDDSSSAHDALTYVQNVVDEAGLHMLDLLHVQQSRWRSILCTDPLCCPDTGNAILSNVETDSQLTGPDEGEVGNLDFRLQPLELSDQELAQRDEAFANVPEWPIGSPTDLFDWRDKAVTAVVALLENRATTDWSTVAAVCTALSDIRARDGVLRRLLEHQDAHEVVLTNLQNIFSQAPERYAASVATVFAGAVWLKGNRALARHAIDIALKFDSDYSLARLLDTALIHGVPYGVWVDSLRAVAYDKCLVGAA